MTYETTRDFVPWEDVNDFDAAVEMLLLGIAKKYSDRLCTLGRCK